MKKSCFLVCLAATLCISDVQAQRSYSSGSRSYSRPSSSSFSRSSSSSFGRSYSSSKPSVGRTYYTQSKPPSSSKPSPAATSPSGRRYSNGSPPPAKTTPSQPSKPSQPKYSNGPPKTGPPSQPSSANSAKPTSKGWNPGLSSAAQREQSKQAYQRATRPADAPKPTYRTSKGEEKPLNPQAPAVKTVRNYVTHERYVTYEHRATIFYGPYYSHPVYYNDWFSPFLMGYLFSSAVNANERAYWVYCHRADMDEARYREMLARDAELSARLKVLEQKNAAVNPNFVVPSMSDNPDLQYSHDFITATYNPQDEPSQSSGGSGVGAFFMWFFVVILCLVALATAVYLMFIKEW